MDETDPPAPTGPSDVEAADGNSNVGARGRKIVNQIRSSAREAGQLDSHKTDQPSEQRWPKNKKFIAGLIATISAFAFVEMQGPDRGGGNSATLPTMAASAGEAVWRPGEGVMPNGKPAGQWTLPDGFTFEGTADLTQQKVQVIAEALRQPDQEQLMQASSQPAQDALDKYIVNRFSQGVSRNEAIALARLINRDAVHSSAEEFPSHGSSDYTRPSYVTPGPVPGSSPIVSIGRSGQNEPVSTNLVAPTQIGSRPRETFNRRFDEYNSPAGSAGIVNTRSGEHYAPAGRNGYVSTRDGTYYSRSGPNGVIDTRTGRYIPTN